MDREEIKQSRSMGDVVALYGLHPNRAGFICCPFHKEKTASLKIYKDSFYCFGCGASGDIFKFVERMEGVSFRDAFLLLGGDYPDKSKESNFARRMKQYHFEKQREMRQKEQAALDVKKQENGKKIDLYRDALKMAEPLSDAWCEAYNNYQLQLYEQCCLYGLETRW